MKSSEQPLPELTEYVQLMSKRALGEAPEMDSAKQMAAILRAELPGDSPVSMIDIGCATGHYLRSIQKAFGATHLNYTGIDIDPAMVAAAHSAWQKVGPILSTSPRFVQCGIEDLTPTKRSALDIKSVDAVFCSNAFMYFTRPQIALENMISMAKKKVIIRGYFCEVTAKVFRAQPQEYHASSNVPEVDILDEQGFPRVYDEWNFYSYTFMEALVKKIAPHATVAWIDDSGASASIETEAKQNIVKRGATQVIGGMQIMTPFIQTWRYLVIRL
jgi:ubiquinone/menaquinone biosynthesis C-methylase UbiE